MIPKWIMSRNINSKFSWQLLNSFYQAEIRRWSDLGAEENPEKRSQREEDDHFLNNQALTVCAKPYPLIGNLGKL